MKGTHVRGGALPLAALLVAGSASIALPAPIEAQRPARGGGTEVASASVYAGGVDFMPEVRYRQAIITVSGNGTSFRQVIKAGGDLSIGVFDPAGQLLPDGVYKWALELVPDAKAAEKLRAAAALNGGIAPEAWRPHTGTFAIHNGLVVAPDLVEPRPAPRPEAPVGAALPNAFGAPSAAWAAPADDDSAVGSRKGVEASMRAALQSQPQAAAAGKAPLDGAGLERSDAAAQAMGRPLERVAVPDSLNREAESPRRSIYDNTENGFNGRPVSDDHR